MQKLTIQYFLANQNTIVTPLISTYNSGMGLFRRNKNPRNIDEILPTFGGAELKVTASSLSSSSTYEYLPPIDARVAECPSCQGILRKIPGAKTKCPHCGEFMYVRTEPHSRKRVVVNFEGAERIDDEIARLNGTYDQRLAEKKRTDETRERLKEKFHGQEPSSEDVKWSLLNQDGIKYAREANWYSYMLNLSQKASEWERRGKKQMAITAYLQTAFIACNGPEDFGSFKESGMSVQDLKNMGIVPFNPKKATGNISWIIDELNSIVISEELGLDTAESMFYDVCNKMKMKLPVPKESCWKILLENGLTSNF